jgi:signal transduction histidine kinase
VASIFPETPDTIRPDDARRALGRLESLAASEGPVAADALREPVERVVAYAHQLEQNLTDLETLYTMTVEASTTLENELSMRYDAITSFLANTSHELRTPLNAVIGHAELLLEELADADNHRHDQDLLRIRDAGRHLLALINGILDLSKVEAGHVELCPEEVDVAELVRDCLSNVTPLARVNQNELVADLSPRLGTIVGDPLRIRQCVLNLLSNACKFTRAGRIVTTGTRQHDSRGEWVVLAVHDTGIGMTSEQLARVFRPYAQADARTSRKYGGTGLGLAFTRSLCERMGAEVHATSEPGRGSVFTMRLPPRLRVASV